MNLSKVYRAPDMRILYRHEDTGKFVDMTNSSLSGETYSYSIRKIEDITLSALFGQIILAVNIFQKNHYLITEISYEELVQIAGIESERFLTSFRHGLIDEDFPPLLVEYASKRLPNRSIVRMVRSKGTDNICYEFEREMRDTVSRKRYPETLFCKQFYLAEMIESGDSYE